MYSLNISQFYRSLYLNKAEFFFLKKGEFSEVVSVLHDTMVGESMVQERAEGGGCKWYQAKKE